MAAAAGHLGDADGVGAVAIGDHRRQRRARTRPGHLGRQDRLLGRHRHQGHRRAAGVLLHHLVDRGEGAGRRRVGGHLHHRQVTRVDLVAVGDWRGGQHHRHSRRGRHGLVRDRLLGRLGRQPDPRHEQRPQTQRRRSDQTYDSADTHEAPGGWLAVTMLCRGECRRPLSTGLMARVNARKPSSGAWTQEAVRRCRPAPADPARRGARRLRPPSAGTSSPSSDISSLTLAARVARS